MFRFFEIMSRQFLQFMSNMSDLFEVTIRSPFKNLVRGRDNSTSKTVWILLWPVRLIGALFAGLLWLLWLPVRGLMNFPTPRRVDLIWGIPAVLVLGLVAFVGYMGLVRHKSVDAKYRRLATQAWASKNFEDAQTYFARIVNQSDDPSDRDRYFWAMTLFQTGDQERATAIIDSLAPDDRAGFALAHNIKALNLADVLVKTKDTKVLPSLRFHLERSGSEPSPMISRAWVLLFSALGQPDKAIEHLEAAAGADPKLLLSAAEIYRRKGDAQGFQRTLNAAAKVFGEKLSKDPLDEQSRILYASVLAKQKDFTRAEAVLLTGIKLKDSAVLRRLCADFYSMRADVAEQEGRPFVEQFEFLRKSLRCDINYAPVYERLIKKYGQAGENGPEIIKMLEESIVEGKSTALAHFALSNIYWMDNNKKEATWHIEKAYAIDSTMLMVVNNFAWMISHSETPDLERALELTEEVIAREPANPRYLDTYGTVLMLLKRDEDAIVQFEKCLQNIQTKVPVHTKLEELYRRIGKDSIADLHKKQVEKALAAEKNKK